MDFLHLEEHQKDGQFVENIFILKFFVLRFLIQPYSLEQIDFHLSKLSTPHLVC